MKRYTILSLLLFVGMQAAFTQDNYCNSFEKKIQFEGAAPAPWAIDGSTIDWQTILGPYTGDPLLPYTPVNAGNNWSLDGHVQGRYNDLDSPTVRNDLRFLAHTSDAYNVYLYARRQVNAPGEYSLFYFIDINVDGYMDNGEPVLKIQFSSNRVTQLSIGAYVVNPNEDVGPTGGNYMTAPDGPYAGYADGYTITGSVKDQFSASRIPAGEQLQAGEIFAAAVTEDGYGVEIAVPWRFLRNWVSNSETLQAGDLFAYHAAFEVGGGPYLPQRVVDNAGGCCGGLGVAGNASVLVGDLQSTVLKAGTAYRFRFSFTNNTNVEEKIGMKRIILDNFTLAAGATPDYTSFRITASVDQACNGTVAPAEKSTTFEFNNETADGAVIYTSLTSMAQSVKPGEKVCFVVDVELPAGQFRSFSIFFNPDVSLAVSVEGCFSPSLIDGGKPINPAAFYMDEGTTFSTRRSVEVAEREQSNFRVFPNPSKGVVNVEIPRGAPQNMELLDNTGRLVQQFRGVQPGVFSIKSLSKGVYFLRLVNSGSQQVVTRKVVVD